MAVLYVDDDEAICWLMEREWKKAFPEVKLYTARTPKDALSCADERDEELRAAVIDWRLSGTTAQQLIQDLRHGWPGLCVISTSAAFHSGQVESAKLAGADDFLIKDLSVRIFVREVAARIKAVLDRRGGLSGLG